ncbi:MAG: hypothetical protein H5U01_13330 [Clostridia bacterium]|nr:hypothetical protein [Clostridia bacterium]
MEKQRAENRVSMSCVLAARARVLEEQGVQVRLFLEGKSGRGPVFVPAVLRGKLAERVRESASSWQEGEEFFVEGELDWESSRRSGEWRYQLILAVSRIQKLEASQCAS